MKKLTLTGLATLIFASSLWAENIYELTLEAEKAMAEKNFAKALEIYQKALEEHPEDPILNYNSARVLYRLKEFEKSQKNFENSLNAQDLQLEAKVRKNLGNTHFQRAREQLANPQMALSELEKAYGAYCEALQITPEDPDLSHNQKLSQNLIEKLKELLQQQQQQQSDKSDSSKENQDQQNGNSENQNDQLSDSKESENSQENTSEQNEQKKNQNNNSAQNQENNQNNQQNQTQQQEQSSLDPKQAEELLRRARQHERERQEFKKRKLKGTLRGTVEKDW